MRRWKFSWLTSWDEIWNKGFVDQWKTWLDHSPSAHVFFHPALVKAWVETYRPLRTISPWFLIAEATDHKIFFPLILWRRNWKNSFQRLLVPVGHSDYDYHDPILVGAAESFDWSSFWDEFEAEISERFPVAFDRLFLGGIHHIHAGSGNAWTEGDICPFADISNYDGSEQYLASLKASLRGDLRRQCRRMDEIGKTEFIVFSPDQKEEAIRELNPFLAAHARRWPSAYKPPGLHSNIVDHCLSVGLLHFSILKISGKTAAWHFGFTYRDRFYYYLPAQEKEFESVSPGKVLLLRCVGDAISRGLKIFDHLRGEENYKTGWADKREPLFTYLYSSRKPSSKMRNIAVDRFKSIFLSSRWPFN